MEVKGFEVVEWRIDNFCSWNSAVHPFSIASPGPLQNKTTYFKLYPKGHDGSEEHISIRIKNVICAPLSGELALIGPDGCLLSLHLINTRSSDEFYQGPKYEDVVAHIRNSESVQKDFITVQCRLKSSNNYNHVMSSSIDISEVTFKFDPTYIVHLVEIEESEFAGYIKCFPEKVGIFLRAEDLGTSILFSLEEENDIDMAIWLEFGLHLLSSDGNVVRHEKIERMLFDDNDEEDWSEIYSFRKLELEGKDITLIFNLKFTSGRIRHFHNQICCFGNGVTQVPKDNAYFGEEKSSDTLAASTQVGRSVTVLSKDLLGLYQDKEFSDLQLKCGDVLFPVHRNILSARSPVFKRLLLSNMREAASGMVDIKDLDAPTLSLFLTHLYTGTVKDMQSESCLNLYYAADKYDVPTLKRECAEFIRANILVSNVTDVLSLADKHQDDLLKISAYAFILRNFREVTRSEEWKTFMNIEPFLAAETLTQFAQKKYVKCGNAKLSDEPSV